MPFIHKLTRYKCLPALLYVVLSDVLLLFVLKHVCPVRVEGFNLPSKVLPDNWPVLNSAVLFLCPVLSENLSWMFATLDAFIVVSHSSGTVPSNTSHRIKRPQCEIPPFHLQQTLFG